jgi:hypothetical protein
MSALDDEVKKVRAANPGWDFQTAWVHITKTQPWRFAKSAAMNRLEAQQAPVKEKEAREKYEHIEAVARRLMERDRQLTFGRALEITRTCLPRVRSEIKELLRPKSKETEPTGLVQAGNEPERSPHPGQASAIAKGLLLVEGGFTAWIIPQR